MIMKKTTTEEKSVAKKKTRKKSSKKAESYSKAALVVVESPTKAKTLGRYLGSGYHVIASQGHVMDLPASRFGVDLKAGFTPDYIVIHKKRRIVKELKLTAAKFKEIYLATDPDREGEAISSHLATLLGEGKKVHRAVFHEITPEAIQHAFHHTAAVDPAKVDAQQARRVLDRILGYSLSPLLWKKVGTGLSAGRVQSVVLRLIVDRERAVRAFVPEEYWQIQATLQKEGASIKAGKSAADAGIFTANLETVDGKKAELKVGETARALVDELEGVPFVVSQVTKKEQRRNPPPPFTTSTLQQDAFNKLGFTAARTMRIAQQLYEGIELGSEGPAGLITYMRTDSVQVAQEAVRLARNYIDQRFGHDYLPEAPRRYRSRKRAQEAHEAIRPTAVQRDPDRIKSFLTTEQRKLYTLIWNRFLASQMASARVEVTSVDLTAGRCGFRAAGTRIVFAGFLKIIKPIEEKPAEEEPPLQKGEKRPGTQILPELTQGERVKTLSIDPSQHFTKPPPRYTEASLVRTMEELGIGRPSTYAPTIQTISNRGYVVHQGRALIPEELGEIVTDLLSEHFPKVLDVKYTAHIEEELDEVEEGRKPWAHCVAVFYKPFSAALESAHDQMQTVKKEPEPIDETCPQCSKQLVIKWGRNGKFISCSGFPDCRFSRSITTGVKCPEAECDGELVARRSRRGRFFGCSKYPACRHIAKTLPTPPPAEPAGEPGTPSTQP